MYSAFLVSKSECMTCNNQVLKTLGTLQGVFGAEMDRIDGRIIVNHTDEVTREEIGAILITLGFPERKEEQAREEEKEVETDEPSIWGCAL
jgi:copper chaperone CopZ